MPLLVGNLLTDTAANSFISLEDALAYFGPEIAMAEPGTQLGDWMALDPAVQEASLSRASRWMAETFTWYRLEDETLPRVGRVAARLAVETIGRSIFGGTEAAGIVVSESVDGVGSVTYRSDVRSDVSGLSLPWLRQALSGLVQTNTKWLSRA